MSANLFDFLKWLNLITLIAVIFANILAGSTTLIGGKVTAQISDENLTLITPAGYIFSIWGIIYILLAVFVINQLLPSGEEAREKVGCSLLSALF
jgi:hypothetical protein